MWREDSMHLQAQHQMEEISSPLTAQILEFCESELFPETLQTSEVASISKAYYNDHSSYISLNTAELNNISSNIINNDSKQTTTKSVPLSNTCNPSIIVSSAKDHGNGASASTEFSSSLFSSPNIENGPQEQLELFLLQNQVGLTKNASETAFYQNTRNNPNVPLKRPPLPSIYEEDHLSVIPSNAPLFPFSSHACSFLNPSLPNGNSEISDGNIFLNNGLQPQQFDYEGDDGGIICTEPLSQVHNAEFQNNFIDGGANFNPLPTEITNLDDPTFKASKITAEEKKEKIHRYLKKRNERNFSKKIKVPLVFLMAYNRYFQYACRKNLADSRLRVRGRFAKNGNFGDNTKTCANHDDGMHFRVRDEENMVDHSDILAHINGVNSFTYSYSTVESWI